MLTRRELLARTTGLAAAAFVPLGARPAAGQAADGVWLNDIHSQLNRTRVRRVERPATVNALSDAIRTARSEQLSVSIAAGRHAMGGQQFGTDTVLIDMNGLDGIFDFDADRGQVEVGGGIQWPALISGLLERQKNQARQWGIAQKQTGADRLSIGGGLAANAHGRGLTYAPMAQDVEALTLVDANGEQRRCSRTENQELFGLVLGGYGLFGPVASVRLRLKPRQKIERIVEVTSTTGLAGRFADRIANGFLFGDFQYSTDLESDGLLREGVFSCYRAVADSTPVPEAQAELSRDNWLDLLQAGHLARAEAYKRYSSYYLQTSGQIYWSDTHQLSEYIDDYHQVLGQRLGPLASGTEMITEIYVPRPALASFLEGVRADVRQFGVNLIYGTIRLIERDRDSFLAWAREPWACVIVNVHTAHDPASLAATETHFRRLIDRGREHGGSYFLTYHRWATREQVLSCYPQLPEFLALKRKYDPEERFQSEWYRHYRAMFA
ncbi:MAG: FAD-binding protein [Vicinamibacterales bacterium]